MTLATLSPAEHDGQEASITYGGRTWQGRLFYAKNPSYRIAVRHWFIAVPSQSIHFREDAVSLQWAPSDAEITFESERAA